MHRFYYDFLITKKEDFKAIIIKEKDLLNQLINVLRFSIWENIILFNWKVSIDYVYTISKIEKNQITLDYVAEVSKKNDNSLEVNLYQSLPNKLDKLEYILQKWVEVWIGKFVIFWSDRSQKLILSENKIERLKKIIIEAVEQSGGSTIPELVILGKKLDLKNDNSLNLCFHTKDEKSVHLKDLDIWNKKEVNLFVWPEGGFSEKEVDNFKSRWFILVFLWNRILRTETVWSVVWFYLGQKQ